MNFMSPCWTCLTRSSLSSCCSGLKYSCNWPNASMFSFCIFGLAVLLLFHFWSPSFWSKSTCDNTIISCLQFSALAFVRSISHSLIQTQPISPDHEQMARPTLRRRRSRSAKQPSWELPVCYVQKHLLRVCEEILRWNQNKLSRVKVLEPVPQHWRVCCLQTASDKLLSVLCLEETLDSDRNLNRRREMAHLTNPLCEQEMSAWA